MVYRKSYLSNWPSKIKLLFIYQNTLDIYLQSDKLLIENLETGNLYGMYIHHIRGKRKKTKQLSTSFLERFQTPSSQFLGNRAWRKAPQQAPRTGNGDGAKHFPARTQAEEIVQADKGRGRQKTCQPWRKIRADILLLPSPTSRDNEITAWGALIRNGGQSLFPWDPLGFQVFLTCVRQSFATPSAITISKVYSNLRGGNLFNCHSNSQEVAGIWDLLKPHSCILHCFQVSHQISGHSGWPESAYNHQILDPNSVYI